MEGKRDDGMKANLFSQSGKNDEFYLYFRTFLVFGLNHGISY